MHGMQFEYATCTEEVVWVVDNLNVNVKCQLGPLGGAVCHYLLWWGLLLISASFLYSPFETEY